MANLETIRITHLLVRDAFRKAMCGKSQPAGEVLAELRGSWPLEISGRRRRIARPAETTVPAGRTQGPAPAVLGTG